MNLTAIGNGRFKFTIGYYSKVLSAEARSIPGLQCDGRSATGRLDAIEVLLDRLREIGLQGVPETPHYVEPFGEPSGLHYHPTALRDYQVEGIRALVSRRRMILADAMGLGKTGQSIVAAANALEGRHGTIVVIAPAYVVPAWIGTKGRTGELQRWLPIGIDIFECTGEKRRAITPAGAKRGTPLDTRKDLPHGVYVLSYGVAHAWRGVWPEIDVLIVDEAHYVTNEKARRSVAVQSFANVAHSVYLLTGTPLTNRVRTIWFPLHILYPNAFGNFFQFGLRYCAAVQKEIPGKGYAWDFDGASHLDELHRRLRHVMVRRTLRDVALELPAKTRVIDPVVCDRSFARGPILEDVKGPPRPGDLQNALDEAAEAKLPAVLEMAIDAARSGEHVVVFSHRKSIAHRVLAAARAEGIAADIVTGDIDPSDRLGVVLALAQVGTGSILAATIDAAGVGIDLSYASTCFFAELTWEPHKLLQAEARLHRHGQHKPVFIHYPIATGSIDEAIRRIVVGRLGDFEAAIGGTGETLDVDLLPSESAIMSELYAMLGG